LSDYLPHVTVLTAIDTILILTVIPVVLVTKRDPTVAVAWCLLVLFVPILGVLLFWGFGYNYVHRRVKKVKRHHDAFQVAHPPARHEADRGAVRQQPPHELASLALAVDAFPVSGDNRVSLYHETTDAYEALLAAVAAARHHVHLEFYILRTDQTGRRLIDLLTEKAKAGVEVRLMYDAVGGLFLWESALRPLRKAGGKVAAFLPVNPIRSWIQVNLRNHRKVVVVDGAVGFTGGMNVGDEYLGKDAYFGYWRDSFLKIEGPGVAGLQRVFIEDWHFATAETLNDEPYFPPVPSAGAHGVQIVESGPDQDVNSIRSVYFAAIVAAKKRVWIATPYFVPDVGMLDALRLACLRGVDVRLLSPARSDNALSYYAGRYYWADLLSFGASVWTYVRGMMHAKVVIVDDDWAMLGSPNLDNRSLHLNFELACLLYSRDLVADLAARFEHDLGDARRVDPEAFERRGLMVRLIEDGCRLFAPIL
jgi:cardiolipin synthase